MEDNGTSLRSAFHFFACGWDLTASAINYVSAVANIFDASAIIFDASAKNFDFRHLTFWGTASNPSIAGAAAIIVRQVGSADLGTGDRAF